MRILINPGDDRVLDLQRPGLSRLCIGRDLPVDEACTRPDTDTRGGQDMRGPQQLWATAVASVVGRTEERAISSLFTRGGTHAVSGEFAGKDDFEVAAFFVILPGQEGGA